MSFLNLSHRRVEDVMDAAYAFAEEPDEWAGGMHRALEPVLELGQGTLVGLVRFPAQGICIEHLASRGTSRVHHAVVRLSAFLAPEKLRASFFNGCVIGTSSGHYAEHEMAAMERRANRLGTRDAVGLCVNDGVDWGFMLISPTRERVVLPPVPAAMIRKLGAHVSNGLRLQRVVASSALEDPAVEAIFDNRGSPQQALGMSREPGALAKLRESVAARTRTQGAVSTDHGGQAWSALVEGRWSLVDRFDTDGKRYVVAYRNPPGVLDPRRLTPREECVVAMAAMGRSNKEIGFELGISESTVSTLLSGALKKLGLGSRTLLPLFWADLQGGARPASVSEAGLVAMVSETQPSDLGRLTETERAVACSMLAGLSDKEIAKSRRSSRRTVAKHAEAVYRKLGVHSRAELASKVSAWCEGGRQGKPAQRQAAPAAPS